MYIGQRLKQVIDDKGLKLTEFSKLTGVPYRTLQEYILNDITPGGDNLIKICTKFSISFGWLLIGEGEMYEHQSSMPALVDDRPMEVREIDRCLMQLKPEQWQEILLRTQEMIRLNELEAQVRKLEGKS